MNTYMQERRVFDRLRKDMTTEAKQDYELACAALVERYNTTIHENRFLVGGAVEVFTYALLRSVGIPCNLYADTTRSGDILLPNDKKISVKSRFEGGPKTVTLINKKGGGERTWETATFFVLAEVGIVFGIPTMVSKKYIKDTGDSQDILKAGVEELMMDTANVIEMELIRKPPTEMAGFSHKASAAVARQILQETSADSLLKAFSN